MATGTYPVTSHRPEFAPPLPQMEGHVSGCELSEGVYPPGLRLRFQTQGTAYFCFIQMGSVSDLYPQQTVTYSAGSLLFFPADGQHVVEFLEHTRVLIVRISRELLGRVKQDLRRAPGAVLVQGWEGAWLMRKLHAEFVRIGKRKSSVGMEDTEETERSLVLE